MNVVEYLHHFDHMCDRELFVDCCDISFHLTLLISIS